MTSSASENSLSSEASESSISAVPPPRQHRGAEIPAMPDRSSQASLPSYLVYGRDNPTVPPLLKHSRREKREQKNAFKRVVAQLSANDHSVTALRLRGCKFSSNSAKLLCHALQNNTKVVSIDLSHLGFADPDDLLLLLPVLRRPNSPIQELNVQACSAPVIFARKFDDMLRCNYTVRKATLYSQEELDFKRDEVHFLVRSVEMFCAQNINLAKLPQGGTTHLNLSNRAIDRVDPALLVAQLTVLTLSFNQLLDIPPAVFELVQLHTLNVASNQLTQLSESVGNLKLLKKLNLSGNKLSKLPESLHALLQLESLDISANAFTALPDFLPHMRHIQKFSCAQNRLKNVPKSMMMRGDKLVLSYLREISHATQQCYKMKIITVGRGNVGKTSLLSSFFKLVRAKTDRSARKLKWKDDNPNVATDGIAITDMKIRCKLLPSSEDRLELSFWDFAGQDIYCTTHTFFLSGRAVYLLTFDMSDLSSIDTLEYWCQSIKARAPESPVIIVGTHLDDPICTRTYIDTHVWPLVSKTASVLKNVNCCLALSTKTGLGLPEFVDALYKCALAQPFMPETVPHSYLKLDESIRAISASQPTMSLTEFTSLASRCGVHPDNVQVVCSFLSETGTISYFPESNPDLVITHPQWITDTLSTIITLKSNFVKQGFLLHSDLPQIWRPPLYPEHLHPFLISLLEKFDLIYLLAPPLPTSDDAERSASQLAMSAPRYFIPAVLQSETPDLCLLQGIWPPPLMDQKEKFVGRNYRFQFLPVGLFPRIIVRFCRSFTWKPVFYWQTGIVLALEGHQAILLVENREIRIRIRGTEPGTYIGPFCENIDTLVNESLRLTFTVKIPCSHCLAGFPEFEQDVLPPFDFDLNFCEDAVASNRNFVMCRGTTPVAVSELAPDLALIDFRDTTIAYADIEIGSVIGMGGFATVYKAFYMGKPIALKKIQLSLLPGEQTARHQMLRAFAEFRREVQLLASLRYEYVVALRGIVLDPFCIALEFMDLGNLYELIHDERIFFDWHFRVHIGLHVAKGMAFIHSLEMIHRDLKSPNILLKSENETVVAKIADFGLSRKLSLTPTLVEKGVDNPVWLAPEILKNLPYDQSVDTYAFGVILYELLARQNFLGDSQFMSELEKRVLAGERPELPPDMLIPSYGELMKLCWAQAPEQRPPFTKIVSLLEEMVALPVLPPSDPQVWSSIENTLSTSEARQRSTSEPQESAPISAPDEQTPEIPEDLDDVEKEKRPKKSSGDRARSMNSVRFIAARALWDFVAQEPDELTFTAGTMIQIIEMDGDFLRGRIPDTGEVGWFQADFVERLDLQSTLSPPSSDGPESRLKSPTTSFYKAETSTLPIAHEEDDATHLINFFVPTASLLKQDEIEAERSSSIDSSTEASMSSSGTTETSGIESAPRDVSPTSHHYYALINQDPSAKPIPSSSSSSSSSSTTTTTTTTTMTTPSSPIPSSSSTPSTSSSSSPNVQPETPPPVEQKPTRLIAIAAFTASRPDMISFAKDDIIELVEKKTKEWWVGIHNGTRGLFPGPYTQPCTD